MTTKIKLTKRMTATVDEKGRLVVETNQSVGGSGARNMLVWALRGLNHGYKQLVVRALSAKQEAKESLIIASKEANALLALTGASILLEFN